MCCESVAINAICTYISISVQRMRCIYRRDASKHTYAENTTDGWQDMWGWPTQPQPCIATSVSTYVCRKHFKSHARQIDRIQTTDGEPLIFWRKLSWKKKKKIRIKKIYSWSFSLKCWEHAIFCAVHGFSNVLSLLPLLLLLVLLRRQLCFLMKNVCVGKQNKDVTVFGCAREWKAFGCKIWSDEFLSGFSE